MLLPFLYQTKSIRSLINNSTMSNLREHHRNVKKKSLLYCRVEIKLTVKQGSSVLKKSWRLFDEYCYFQGSYNTKQDILSASFAVQIQKYAVLIDSEEKTSVEMSVIYYLYAANRKSQLIIYSKTGLLCLWQHSIYRKCNIPISYAGSVLYYLAADIPFRRK